MLHLAFGAALVGLLMLSSPGPVAAETSGCAQLTRDPLIATLLATRPELLPAACRSAPAPFQIAALDATPLSDSETPNLRHHLEDVDDEITLNEGGEKYAAFEFSHADHSKQGYLADMNCRTCHHTQELDEKPDPCSKCHEIGGEAKEKKAKTKASHAKSMAFPVEADQESVSCVGCHKAQNALLDDGEREGEEAPTGCKTGCHDKLEAGA